MSARGLWIVALGAALAVLIALNVFRSEEPGSVDAETASRPSSGGGIEQREAAERPADAVRGSAPPDRRADAPGADGRGATSESQPAPESLPNPGPYASISAALEDHDVPPERRMPRPPEMLETERTFAAESRYPVWSAAVEAGVLRRIAQIPAAAYVSVNVECRTTLCLLQFVESATPAPSSSIADVAKLVEPEGLKSIWMMGIRVRGGAPVGIAYLERVQT